jgi:hypothetical protein
MAYGRCILTTPTYESMTPMRRMRMRCPFMGEMHANHAYEMHAYKMPIYGRTTPVRDTLGRCTLEMHA